LKFKHLRPLRELLSATLAFSGRYVTLRSSKNAAFPESDKTQIPPDLVVKLQAIDIVEVI
jgi:hypothetical protein